LGSGLVLALKVNLNEEKKTGGIQRMNPKYTKILEQSDVYQCNSFLFLFSKTTLIHLIGMISPKG